MNEDNKMKAALFNGLIVIMAVLCLIAVVTNYVATKDFDTKVVATKVDEYNVNNFRVSIGYVDTAYGERTVYDTPLNMVPVYTTYQYEYEGELYTFEVNTVLSQVQERDIWIDSDNPQKWVDDIYKISF